MSTTTTSSSADPRGTGAERGARAAVHELADTTWGERLLRTGIAARAFVFVVLGYLVARIALGALGQGGTQNPASAPGVAQTIAERTDGRTAVLALGIGLALFALYSVVEAVRAHDDESSESKRWLGRAQSMWQCVIYAAFAVYCLRTALSDNAGHSSASQSDRRQQQWSAEILRWPAGPLWLAVLAAVLFAIAGYQLHVAVTRRFMKDLNRQEMSPGIRRATTLLGVIGTVARAAMFTVVGCFIALAAVENDPRKGEGVDGAARALAQNAGGVALLWALACGLAVYGLYLFAEARYRTI